METQTVIVIAIVTAATAYGLLQIYRKLKPTTAHGSCESGCGKCKSK